MEDPDPRRESLEPHHDLVEAIAVVRRTAKARFDRAQLVGERAHLAGGTGSPALVSDGACEDEHIVNFALLLVEKSLDGERNRVAREGPAARAQTSR